MSNIQDELNALAESIATAPAEELDALIAVRGMLSKRIGEIENPTGVEVTMQAEGIVGEAEVKE